MQGLMMEWQLTLTHFLDRARRIHSRREVVGRDAGGIHRYTFADWARRCERLAGALTALGVKRGERVGTFAWNTHRHYEVYFAAPCMGAVLHTINVRLFPEQLAYVINDAADVVLMVDASLLPAVEKIRSQLTTVRHIVVMNDTGGPIPAGYHDYEALLKAAPATFAWPSLEEREAAALCYTSGTTGHPKGVLYSHRALVLHTFGISLADSFQLCERDVLLSIVPMFHANAWGLPFAAAMLGCKVVMPGPQLAPKDLVDLIEAEGVTFVGGVPTIVAALYQYLKQSGRTVPSLHQVIVGGSALPRVLLEGFEQLGIEVVHAWGMTELAPAGSVARLRGDMMDLSKEEQYKVRLTQGTPFPLVELRVRTEAGEIAPWDGVTAGELEARGPWVVSRYYGTEDCSSRFDDGWFRTGDVATIDERGFVKLLDRTKDMVKSGGEWISSVDLENAIMSHPEVAEAAVVAISHPKWTERPLACVVPKATAAGTITRDSIRGFLRGKVADWWLPDDVAVVDVIPKTGVGKFDKKVLRERFKDHVWPEAQ